MAVLARYEASDWLATSASTLVYGVKPFGFADLRSNRAGKAGQSGQGAWRWPAGLARIQRRSRPTFAVVAKDSRIPPQLSPLPGTAQQFTVGYAMKLHLIPG